MTPGQMLLAALALVKEHSNLIPDDTIRGVTDVALDMLSTGAEALQHQDVTPEEFRQQLARELPSKWQAMINARFAHDTDPEIKVPE